MQGIGFGQAVAGAGDVEGDGVGELLVGSADGVPDLAGRAYVFSGVSPAALTLAAAPLNSTVPRGDSLYVRATLTSGSDRPLTGALRLDVAGPNGRTTSRVLVTQATLAPGQTARPVFAVAVPLNAPRGEYTGVVVAESLSGASVTSAPFAFRVVSGSAALAAREADDTGAAAFALGAASVVEAGGLVLGGAGVAAQASAAPLFAAVVGPNPASGRAGLAVVLEAPSEVRVVLYDVLGREVAAVDAGTLPPGSHRVGLDVSALPASVYVWRLAAGARIETGRLTVAR